MVFSSIEFLLFFLPIFLILYGLAPDKTKNEVLLTGSLIFYALGDVKYLPLLMVSVLMNYWFGLHLERRGGVRPGPGFNGRTEAGQGQKSRDNGKEKNKEKKVYDSYIKDYGNTVEVYEGHVKVYEGRINGRAERNRRMLFVTAILLNAAILICFKYLRKEGLPLGISFYTFQMLTYLVDVYRGEEKTENSFVKFAVYVTMFPQLISGPIINYGQVRDALRKRRYTIRGIQEGLKIFTLGLAAKVLLADTIGLLWRDVQSRGFESISTQLAWLAAAAYSLMIYFDFCGYSLMAVGLGRMLGFELPMNFKTPYMAGTVREFYRRWHISLGKWFTRYIYIPLGGNRRGAFRTVCNLLAVWVLTAVWHGSTMNFLIWGLMLWLFIVMERGLEAIGVLKHFEKGVGKAISHLYLWAVIPVTWMCFAIPEIEQLQIYLGRMFGLIEPVNVSAGDWLRVLESYRWLLAAGLSACTPAVMKLFRRFKDTLLGGIVLVLLFWLCVYRLQMAGDNPFLYLQF